MSNATARQGAPASPGALEVTALDGARVELDELELSRLGRRLHGRVLLPTDQGFDDAVEIWNGMITKRPAVVVQPESAADVQMAVAFAREHELSMSVKGGGHHAAGTALTDGGLTIDMGRMRSVLVDPVRRLAFVQPGCRLGDVDAATQAHGLATVLGSDADTGVAGFALGGGFGYLSRRFGWAVDNLVEAEVVTANGELLRAAADEHPDLYWALRGGSGNFGVVTRFTFRLHEVGPRVIGGMLMWDARDAARVLDIYREVSQRAPRALTLVASMRVAGYADLVPAHLRGKPVVGVLACHTGDPARAGRDLAPLRESNPALDTLTSRPYTEQQFVLGFPQPRGMHQYWKSEFLGGLDDGLLDAYRQHGAPVQSPRSQLILFNLGGAIGDHAPAATAMGNRDAAYAYFGAATWLPGEPPEPHMTWVRDATAALLPFATGGTYVNAQNEDDDAGRVAAAYRDSLARLTEVKAVYDPTNFFRSNRNIAPARSMSSTIQTREGRPRLDSGRVRAP